MESQARTITDIDIAGINVVVKLDITPCSNQTPSSWCCPNILLSIQLLDFVPVMTPDFEFNWREQEFANNTRPLTFALRPQDIIEIDTHNLIPNTLSSIYNLEESGVHNRVVQAVQSEFQELLPGFITDPKMYADVAMVEAVVIIERYLYEENVDDMDGVVFEVPELKRVVKGEIHDEDNKCSICLEHLFDDGDGDDVDVVVKLPNCKHVFHEGCIKNWMVKSPKCPLCRSNCMPKLQEFTHIV